MNFLFDLAGAYDFLCMVWSFFPYYLPGTQIFFKPFHYLFNITNRCNLKCDYCCQKTRLAENRPDLSLEEILGIVRKLPRYAVIALSGGEPLCREDFLEIIKGISEQKKKAALLTNGLLLSDAVICGIIRYKLLNIGIAIDGDQKYYEKIKGKGNYSILMDNLDRLVYHKRRERSFFPAWDWKVTVFPENADQLPMLYKQAIQYGADTFTVSLPKKNDFQFSDCLHGLEILCFNPESISDLRFHDNIRELYDELLAMSRSAKTKLRTYPRLKQSGDLCNYFSTAEIQRRYSACREPWSGAVISAAGEIYPCLSVKIGDLKKQSLFEVLRSPENIQFRARLKKNGLFPICDGCCYAKLKPFFNKGNHTRA
jgi:radical SAM protein with 4Fe4S-binding SPASM domain